MKGQAVEKKQVLSKKTTKVCAAEASVFTSGADAFD